MAMGNTGYPLRKFSRSFPGRGGHWGVPNTTIPYKKLANTEIPCRKWTNTDTAYMIGDAYLTLYPSRVFFCQACIHQKSTSAFVRKCEKILN